MFNVKITIMYNGTQIAVMPKKIVPKILSLIKKLIPKYFQQMDDKIEEIVIKIRKQGCRKNKKT